MGGRLAIVIVNYRTPGLVIDCLRSLVRETRGLDARVTIVDNAAGDGSVERIAAAIDAKLWGGWASLMPLDRNGGFGSGNNAALRPLLASPQRPDYVFLLNPDTVVRPGAVEALLRFMEDHPDVGIVGSRLEDPDGTPQRSAFRFPTVLGELDHGLQLGIASRMLSRWIVAPPVPASACRTDWVSGASMMIRREVFEAISLFDEGYFLYFEEVDLCLRAARAGWPCWYEPRSRVIHLIGQSTGLNPGSVRRRLPDCWFESRRRYFLKNHGRFYAALVDAVWTTAHLLWRVRRVIQRKPRRDPEKMLADFVRHSVFLRGFEL